jgi:hypothetical protein
LAGYYLKIKYCLDFLYSGAPFAFKKSKQRQNSEKNFLAELKEKLDFELVEAKKWRLSAQFLPFLAA